MGRWQLGTPFYALIMSSLNTNLGWGFWTTACIANLIGSLFFYKIDGWIFKKKNVVKDKEMQT
jgi:membrane protein YqaA with SNARE-associated domain